MSHKIFQLSFVLFVISVFSVQGLRNAVRGKKCAQNQVVNKLTVYEDGAIEAECGPLPCGTTGICSEDLSSCKAASEVFSGMKWARNGQSLLLRCCSLQASNKVYIGTDLVTLGSYYTGGPVPEKDMMGTSGAEYDFVANARTEQGGVRVWVYRIVCPGSDGQPRQSHKSHQREQAPRAQSQTKEEPIAEEQQPKFSEMQDAHVESHQSQQEAAVNNDEQPAPNPLQYRPRQSRQPVPSEPVNRVL